MGVLPDGLGDDERGIWRDVPKDLHSILLAIDEAVLFPGIERVRAPDAPAFAGEGAGDLLFHGGLCGLAFLIGGSAEIAAGDEVCGFHFVGKLRAGNPEGKWGAKSRRGRRRRETKKKRKELAAGSLINRNGGEKDPRWNCGSGFR